MTGQGGMTSQLPESRVRWDSGKKFLAGTLKPWHSLPREDVADPSLGVLGQVGCGLEQPGLDEGVPVYSKERNEMGFKVPWNTTNSVMIAFSKLVPFTYSYQVLLVLLSYS